MIVPDVNLLLYTYDSDSPFHAKAAVWWHNAVVHTADADFLRFPHLRWFNPVTGAGSRRVSGG